MKKCPLSPLLVLALANAASAQTPASLPGLALWLDAQDSSTLQISGGQITQWNDKSGNNFHATQATVARQPAATGSINGNTAVRFDATGAGDPNSDGLAVNDSLNLTARPYTAYIVDQYWDTTVAGRTLQGRDGNWLIGKWGGRNAHFTGDWAGPFGAQQPAAQNVAVVTEGVGGTYFSYQTRNGVTVGHNNVAGNPGRLGFGASGGFDETSRADVGEVIIFNRVLADNERRTMNNYLSQRWDMGPAFQREYAAQTVRFTGADAGEGLDFQGTFVAGVNAAGAAVNVGNATFAADSGQIAAPNTVASGSWGAWNLGGSADDAALAQVMGSIRWAVGAGSSDVSTTVTGLSPGHAYRAQVLFGENCCADRHFSVSFGGEKYISDLAAAAIQGPATPTAGTAVVFNFLATGSSLNIGLGLSESAGGDRNPIMSGYTVEDLGAMNAPVAGRITGVSTLDTTGTFDYAIDFGNTSSANGPGAKVVNGLTFQSAESATSFGVFAENNIPYHLVDLGPTADDNALEDILHTIRYEDTASEGEVLATDLPVTAGQMYKLTLLFADSNAANREFDVNVDGMRIWDNYRVGTFGGTTSFLTWEFTAPDAMLNVMLDGFTTSVFNNAGGDDNPILSGLMLERVPEPSAGLLAAAAGLLALRRRRVV